ncbi:glycoside hydrolase family 15 protein [Crassisporium funariophilum]|nr:glycoside hydrolase family 15 protein [Crassisporium funariophilum]
MRFVALSSLAYCATVLGQNIDSYMQKESPIAKAGVLANIGPSGAKASGAAAGIVIASPSTTNPDYLFTWTRDSSLTFKLLIDQYTQGQDVSPSLRQSIDQFVTAEAHIQQVSNPSGTIHTGGLGEPKFNIDMSAFTGPWGRPQRDGPALRATAIITYANWLIDAESNTTFVTTMLWPILKLDLNYVAASWNLTGFDLWEEVLSSSFFTTAVQHRALRQGAALATRIGEQSVSSEYSIEAAKALCFMQSYWNPSGGFITANTGGGRCGLDANTVLASIHTYDVDAGCDATTFQPCSDKALSNLKIYVDSFRSIYNINSNAGSGNAVATGRYPEDFYQGGNPWYLTTAAVAEQLYLALHTWAVQGSIEVTSTSLDFFRQFSSSVVVGTYSSASSEYLALTDGIQTFADSSLSIIAKFTPENGAISEQFDKKNGAPISAVDLTWSYAALLTAFAARSGVVPIGWGAQGLTVPSSCARDSDGGVRTVVVTFNVDATTVMGENIYISGSIDALQNWSADKALLLSSANYPIWSITVLVPASATFEYKYLRKSDNGAVTWESDPRNTLTTPSSGAIATHDTWR